MIANKGNVPNATCKNENAYKYKNQLKRIHSAALHIDNPNQIDTAPGLVIFL